ncbi:hypothetical protein DT73_26210 [Mangrovibacter sp. MFB070]|uniref:DUF3833 domain-containing protein n=1 Tax=Mangrovibacter sp. MFB070 TaxID=1224318 RepID=UPI0004D6930C|nr:DUF3833 domain-containing protein [Mangrovibacter sp. MFB070]KEA49934.1 hypothetical protein DT73_26210 [Mangrovibacter sp. MFB070]
MTLLKRAALVLLALLTGCSTTLNDYQGTQPPLDIFSYFNGQTEAWGMVQGRSGKQLRRFHVEITGEVTGDTLTLNEHFVYDDGEKQQRVWHIRRTGNNQYTGTANDIEGVAVGQSAGNAFNWHYKMNVTTKGKTWLLSFDDWMYLQDGRHLFNKTTLTKFGFTAATVTLFFTKKAP